MKRRAKKKSPKARKGKALRGRRIGTLRAVAEESFPRDARRWASEAEKLYRPLKKPVTLRLDADVLLWFKAQGRGYQTRINRTLRTAMMKDRKAEE